MAIIKINRLPEEKRVFFKRKSTGREKGEWRRPSKRSTVAMRARASPCPCEERVVVSVPWWLTVFCSFILQFQQTPVYLYNNTPFSSGSLGEYCYQRILFLFLFFFFWLCWVFVSVRGLSLVTASGGHSSSQCAGLSLSRPLLLRSRGSRRTGSVAVPHGPSCSAACGILPDQGSNPRPLHRQADSQPLRHQGSPYQRVLIKRF